MGSSTAMGKNFSFCNSDFLRGGGGGAMSYTTFGTWGRGGDEGYTKLKCFTSDLFTLSTNIH